MTAPHNSTLDRAASLLHAYLDSPSLPSTVELCCLRAAAELQRAGATVTLLPSDTHVTLSDVATTLESLPSDIFETDRVLNAAAELTRAASVLAAP